MATLTQTGAAGKRTGQWALRLSQPVKSQALPGLVGRWTDPSGGRIRTVRLDLDAFGRRTAYAPISAESLGREQPSGADRLAIGADWPHRAPLRAAGPPR
jgi:hypothetical protein